MDVVMLLVHAACMRNHVLVYSFLVYLTGVCSMLSIMRGRDCLPRVVIVFIFLALVLQRCEAALMSIG